MSGMSVFVMKTPENCDICPFCNNCDYTCEVFQIRNKKYTYEVPTDGNKPNWCPLNPVPEKKKVDLKNTPFVVGQNTGWNACIDAITGGES